MDDPGRWLKGLAAGERDACEQMAQEFHGKVFRFLFGLTGDPELAEDLSQETAIQIWAKAAGRHFPNIRALSAWVYKVALNIYRQHRRRHFLETVPLDEAIASSPGDNPELEIERLETIAHVRQAVSHLPEAEKEVLVLKAFQGLTYREIAHATGEPVGTIKWRVARAYELLREILKHEEDDWQENFDGYIIAKQEGLSARKGGKSR